MKSMPETGLFKPKPSHAEAKGDATTRAAREIIRSEAAARDAKTERLKAARMANPPAQPAAAPAKEKVGKR